MSLASTQQAQMGLDTAENMIAVGLAPGLSDSEKFMQQFQVMSMILTTLQSLVRSVREDQETAERVSPVRPVPTGGRRGRP